ncbi:hypothetical protein GK356_25645 [Salmonella enterica]|nr:hypothetical protein [Salmonella enterica]
MGTPRFTPEFKEEAVRQITVRGYYIAKVSDAPCSVNESDTVTRAVTGCTTDGRLVA